MIDLVGSRRIKAIKGPKSIKRRRVTLICTFRLGPTVSIIYKLQPAVDTDLNKVSVCPKNENQVHVVSEQVRQKES